MGRALGALAVLALASVTVGCTGDAGSSEVQSAGPRMLAGTALQACTIKGDHPVQAEASALCGTLQVPEDRSNPDGRQIGLRVAVIPAQAAQPAADPLFVVAGGPGDAATQFFAWMPSVYADVHARQDIVLVDQRGTGDSNPLTLAAMPDTTGQPAASADAMLEAWAKKALGALDADPRQYTSTIAADDLDAVRAALGYDSIDLYGASYGGTLVQYYLRQHGDHVRAAVLDGSTPVDVPVLERMGVNSEAALELLIQKCVDDTACHEAFPNLTQEWSIVLEQLATPITVDDPNSDQQATLTQAMLGEAIHTALLTEAGAALVPMVIHLSAANRWLDAAQLIGTSPSGGSTLLMADEILCSEAWARDDPAEVARSGAGSYSLPWELAKAQQRATMCRYLPRGAVPADDATPVRTDTPVLWVVGDGDPQDPPANLHAVSGQQPNSRIVVMPAQQHVVGHLGCLPSVIAAFLTTADAVHLDAACVAQGAPPPPPRDWGTS